jgi:hypothetical protein
MTSDHRVAGSSPAGCTPQHQRITHQASHHQDNVLGHFLDTFTRRFLLYRESERRSHRRFSAVYGASRWRKDGVLWNGCFANAFLFYGASPRLHEHGDSDYIDLRSRWSLQPELPGSFGGVSGADLWRFDIGRLALADTSPSIFVYPALLSFSCPNRIPIFWRLVTTDHARSSNVSCHEFVKR